MIKNKFNEPNSNKLLTILKKNLIMYDKNK